MKTRMILFPHCQLYRAETGGAVGLRSRRHGEKSALGVPVKSIKRERVTLSQAGDELERKGEKRANAVR